MLQAHPVDFKLLFELVPSPCLILLPDLTITAVNESYLEATMTTRDQILGRNLFEVFPDNPADKGATGVSNLRASLDCVIRDKKPHAMAVQRYDIRKPNGEFEEHHWSPLNKPVLDANDNLAYIIHCVEDVTSFIHMQERVVHHEKAADELNIKANNQAFEIFQRAQEIQEINKKLLLQIEERKLAEGQVNKTKVLLQSTIESLTDILIFSVDKNYCYLNFNSAFKTATHNAYGATVSVGTSMLSSITNENDRVRAKSNCDRSLAGESHITIEEYGDRNKLFFETHYNPIVSDKEVIGVTVLSVNVTERIEAEAKIQSLNKELEAFTYSVAHDLRAPLRIIDGYSTILCEDHLECLQEEGQRLTQVITSNVRKMGRLIDDLLNFSRLGKLSLNLKHADLDTITADVIREQLALTSGERVELKINKLEPAHCDSNLMRHVLSNLISNAIKYSSKKERPVIEIGSHRENGEIVYFVKDNGAGFDMKYADKLFGVFQRLHKSTDFEGTGVGLAIVQRIIKRHGGRVWANAAPEEGATFYFSLPHS